jgi:hypothetical protein
MPDIALAQSAAFEICAGGTCAHPQVSANGQTASCPQGDGCSRGGCYCQLFRRHKNAAANDPWHVVRLDHENNGRHNAANDYRCICVRPILPGPAHTIDGETYATRYVLCGIVDCGLLEVHVVGGPTHKKIKCSGGCADTCKCTLFRLQTSAEPGTTYHPERATWERVAKADTEIEPVAHYYYRCFCIK